MNNLEAIRDLVAARTAKLYPTMQRISFALDGPLGERPASLSYRVVVVTGDLDGAGCEARVFVSLLGTMAGSGERLIDNAHGNFARGCTDVFALETRDLGAIRRVRVRHDNTGEHPAWFLVGIWVQCVSSGQEWNFPCGRWLAHDEDDGSIERTLSLA